MKHAGPDTLTRIAPLLAELRARPVLRERRPGVFELKSRAFLHFHDDPGGVFADLRLSEDFVRLPVTSPSQQSDLLERIDDCLSTIESRATDRRRRQARQRVRRGPTLGLEPDRGGFAVLGRFLPSGRRVGKRTERNV